MSCSWYSGPSVSWLHKLVMVNLILGIESHVVPCGTQCSASAHSTLSFAQWTLTCAQCKCPLPDKLAHEHPHLVANGTPHICTKEQNINQHCYFLLMGLKLSMIKNWQINTSWGKLHYIIVKVYKRAALMCLKWLAFAQNNHIGQNCPNMAIYTNNPGVHSSTSGLHMKHFWSSTIRGQLLARRLMR